MMSILPILTSFGFTESESRIYLTLLEKGSSTASDLARHADLSRQTAYIAIETLRERGLLFQSSVDGVTVFHAESPQKLLTFAQRRESELQAQISELSRHLPDLELLAGREKPAVKMFEGRESIIAAFIELKRTATAEIHEIADLEAMERAFSADDLAPLRVEAQRSLVVRGLYQLAPGRTLSNPLAVQLPASYRNFQGSISVFGDTVILASFEGRMHSIFIQSASIAKTIRLLIQSNLDHLSRSTDASSILP